MQTFELSDQWMISFCQRLGKSLSRHIRRQFDVKLDFHISIEDFQMEIPKASLMSLKGFTEAGIYIRSDKSYLDEQKQ